MNTKLGLALIFGCCIFGLFSACQKENVATSITELSTTATTQTFTQQLAKRVPNNVFIEPITNGIFKIPDVAIPLFPTDIPSNCRQSSCFQLTDTYEELQWMANLNCQAVKREVCCCLQGNYGCFVIKVLPNAACGDTSKIQEIEKQIIDRASATPLETK